MTKLLVLALTIVTLTSCLRTRSELSDTEQPATYGKKAAENQLDGQISNAIVAQTQIAEDKDELIRTLNGRVEVLENQLNGLQKERELEKTQNQEKLTLLQEAITKLEVQVRGSETDTDTKAAVAGAELISSDENDKKKAGDKTVAKPGAASDSKLNSYDVAQGHFAKREWKKAILSFHKYTDEAPKSKLIPDAKYKIGVSFQELGMKDEAQAYFEEVVANFGATDAGKKAKTRLAKLKK